MPSLPMATTVSVADPSGKVNPHNAKGYSFKAGQGAEGGTSHAPNAPMHRAKGKAAGGCGRGAETSPEPQGQRPGFPRILLEFRRPCGRPCVERAGRVR
jgi:hypothetical protein